MEDLYRDIVMGAGPSTIEGGFHPHPHLEGCSYSTNIDNTDDADESDNMSDLIKSQIATHPLYPELVSAYISCQKVGAPPEIASLLEEIGRVENQRLMSSCTEIGADPQLDEFMGSYCEVLERYKEELCKPFDEATIFLRDIESQLSNLCRDSNPTTSATTTLLPSGDSQSPGEAAAASEDEPSCGDAEPPEARSFGVNNRIDREMKEVLRNKYSGYLSSLRKEFLKKRKNGKLPKDARTALLEWWNIHYRWPYPTEEEKLKLSESTGLDPKQINNWFINQRKRHWKPSEDMRVAMMEGVSGSFDSGDSIH